MTIKALNWYHKSEAGGIIFLNFKNFKGTVFKIFYELTQIVLDFRMKNEKTSHFSYKGMKVQIRYKYNIIIQIIILKIAEI